MSGPRRESPLTYWSVPLTVSVLINALILGAALTLKANPLPVRERRVTVRVRVTPTHFTPPPMPKPKPKPVLQPRPEPVTPKVTPKPRPKPKPKRTSAPAPQPVPTSRVTPDPTPITAPPTAAKGRGRDPRVKDVAPNADPTRDVMDASLPRVRDARPSLPDMPDLGRTSRADLSPTAVPGGETPSPRLGAMTPSERPGAAADGLGGARRGADLRPMHRLPASDASAGDGPPVFIALSHGDIDLSPGAHENPGYSAGGDSRLIALTPGTAGGAGGDAWSASDYGLGSGLVTSRGGDGPALAYGGTSRAVSPGNDGGLGSGLSAALAALNDDCGPSGMVGRRGAVDPGLGWGGTVGTPAPRGGGDGPGPTIGGTPSHGGTRIATAPAPGSLGGPDLGITPRGHAGYDLNPPGGDPNIDTPGTNRADPPGNGGATGTGGTGPGHGANDPGNAAARGPVSVRGGQWDVRATLIYPPDARDQGIQGRVELRVQVDVTGIARKVEIARSSGHAILDRYARDQARLWYYYPKDRLARDESITVVVEFRLK